MENYKKFNWKKVEDEADLSFYEVSLILNDCLNMAISIAKNVYRKEIENNIFDWFIEYENEAIAEIAEGPYLTFQKESQKAVVFKEARRYMRANIGVPQGVTE